MSGGRRRLSIDTAIAILAVAVPLVYLALDARDGAMGNVAMRTADIAAVLAAAASALLIARAAFGTAALPLLRRPWRWLAIGAGCNAIAEPGWAWLDVLHPDGNLPAWVHLPYFAAYLPLALGLLAMPPRLSERRELLKFWLDALVVVVAGSMAVYYFVVYPLVTDRTVAVLERIVAVGYPVGDLVLLLGVATVLLRRPPREIEVPLYLLVTGVLLQLVGDVVFTHLQLASGYEAGMLTDQFWLLAYVLLGLAAWWQLRELRRGHLPTLRAAPVRNRSLLPYLSMAYAYLLLGWVALQERAGVLAGLIVGAVGLSALVVARQVVAIVENRRMAAEREANQREKLDAISRLAGGVAHDFNNLLTAIQGNTQLLLDEEQTTDEGRSELLEIARASEIAAGLTRQLLAFDRRHQGRTDAIELNALLRDMQGVLRKLIAPVHTLTIAAGEDAWVAGNRSQLEQVVLNLVSNAGRALGEAGHVTLTASPLRLDPAEAAALGPGAHAGEWSCLTVSDDGCGMDSHTLQHIFEPFFTTHAERGSRGLGLATVHNVVTQYGGWVAVRSSPGRGSTFQLALPATPPAPQADAGEAGAVESAPPTRSLTILVAEDEAPVRLLVRKILERQGYRVLIAESGSAALELAAAHAIDVLLTDVSMPGMSGTELARRLRERQPQLPILFMSGYSDDAVLWSDVRGADAGFLQKPFSPAELATALRHTTEVAGNAA